MTVPEHGARLPDRLRPGTLADPATTKGRQLKPELITEAELIRWAAEWDRMTARAEAAARDGERVAGDSSRSEYTRACAARAAEIARQHAADYRSEVVIMRDGEVPEPYWHLYTTEPETPPETP